MSCRQNLAALLSHQGARTGELRVAHNPLPERLTLDEIGDITSAEAIRRLQNCPDLGRGNPDFTGGNHQLRVALRFQLRHQPGGPIRPHAPALHDQPMTLAARFRVEQPRTPAGAAGSLPQVVNRSRRPEMARDYRLQPTRYFFVTQRLPMIPARRSFFRLGTAA